MLASSSWSTECLPAGRTGSSHLRRERWCFSSCSSQPCFSAQSSFRPSGSTSREAFVTNSSIILVMADVIRQPLLLFA